MKNTILSKLLVISIFLLISCDDSQPVDPEPLVLTSWAPVGAKWYYSGECPGDSGPEDCISYYTIESVRDTVVQGQESRILQVKYHEKDKTTLLSEEIMSGNTKKAYHFNKEEEEFYLLYDFTKEEGDTIEVDSELFQPNWGKSHDYEFAGTVDSVFTIKALDNKLMAQRIKPICREREDYCWTYSSWGGPAIVIEGIGSTYWMFGGSSINILVSYGHIGLRCFSYNGEVYKYNDFPLDCDYIK